MVAVKVFSGLVNSVWPRARAAASLPICSLQRCIATAQQIKADRAGLGSPGPDAVAGRLLGILGNEFFQLCFCQLVLAIRRSGPHIGGSKLRPEIGRTHIYDPDGLEPRPGWLNAEQARRLTGLHTLPELFLSRQ